MIASEKVETAFLPTTTHSRDSTSQIQCKNRTVDHENSTDSYGNKVSTKSLDCSFTTQSSAEIANIRVSTRSFEKHSEDRKGLSQEFQPSKFLYKPPDKYNIHFIS
jgi:hypothetical protein